MACRIWAFGRRPPTVGDPQTLPSAVGAYVAPHACASIGHVQKAAATLDVFDRTVGAWLGASEGYPLAGARFLSAEITRSGSLRVALLDGATPVLQWPKALLAAAHHLRGRPGLYSANRGHVNRMGDQQ